MQQTEFPVNEKKSAKKPVLKIVLFLVIALVAYWVISKVRYASNHEETDDAQIDCDFEPVLSRVGGYIQEIRFEENKPVTKGDTLVLIDARDLEIKVRQAEAAITAAEAAVSVARAGVFSAKANLSTAQANVETAKVRVWKAQQEYNRISNLQKEGTGTAQQFDAAKAEKEAAEAQLLTVNRQQEAAASQVSAAEEQVKSAAAQLPSRKADLDFAQLQLSYACIVAPSSGVASRKNIQTGQLVNAGVPMFTIVSDTTMYITANFKETQIGMMKNGQSVEIKVDAYPGKILAGSIASFSAATGAKFSLLPPDNATGNYVKVVQRVPVKISLNNKQDIVLRPGMSVHVSVTTE